MKQFLSCVLGAIFAAGAACAADAPPAPNAWRAVDPQNLVLIDTKYGEVAVELAPQFAPNHVERMRALIHAHFFDGLSFYRVIDGFVAQGGSNLDSDPKWPTLKAEFDRPTGTETFTPLGSRDLFADQVGYVDGFPVGRDKKEKREWIVHCPGTFAFARDNKPDTASTEFYIVIGEAPRRLDRNLTAFGRVIDGMQYLQKLQRGDPTVDNGVIADAAKRDTILSMKLASDLPVTERPLYEVMRTDSIAFAAIRDRKKNLAPDFGVRKTNALDICVAAVPAHKVVPEPAKP